MAKISHTSDGDFVLAAARALYLGVAVICLVVAVIMLASAGIQEVRSWIPAKQQKVPDIYRVDNRSLDLSIIDTHFAPPTNLTFSHSLYYVDQALSGFEILGHFDAVSANPLAEAPKDFDIIGGADGAKFRRVPYSDKEGRSGLQMAPELVSEINKTFEEIKEPRTLTYSIQVIMRDKFGNISSPADFNIRLRLAPPGTETEMVDPNLTPLQALAKKIAAIVDPTPGSANAAAYRRAMEQPKWCGTTDDNEAFVANYRRAFDHVRTRLTAAKLDQFYLSVCHGWADVAIKFGSSLAARQMVINDNDAATKEAAGAAAKAMDKRDEKLTTASNAFLLFMFVSLLLAFLAIENHARAVRRKLETTTDKTP